MDLLRMVERSRSWVAKLRERPPALILQLSTPTQGAVRIGLQEACNQFLQLVTVPVTPDITITKGEGPLVQQGSVEVRTVHPHVPGP